MSELPVRARDAVVSRAYQAQCRRLGCPWPGGPVRRSFEAANADREAHLAVHRAELVAATGQGELALDGG